MSSKPLTTKTFKCESDPCIWGYLSANFPKNDTYVFVKSFIPPERIDQLCSCKIYPISAYLQATSVHDYSIIKYLSNETTINYADGNGYNALMDYIICTQSPDLEVIKLLANEKTIYKKNVKGETALMLCNERAKKSSNNNWILCHSYLSLYDNPY